MPTRRAGRAGGRFRVAVSVVAALTLALAPGPATAADRRIDPAAGGPPALSLPDRVGAPQWGSWSVRRRPVTAASVVFTGENWWDASTSTGTAAVVGAPDDAYRLLDDPWGTDAGQEILLSPDGARLALPGQVVELRTGRRTVLPRLDGIRVVQPAAWSPDGGTLAVIQHDGGSVRRPDGSETYRETRATLGLVDLASGRFTSVAELAPDTSVPGWSVAFAPDGRTLAYQTGQQIVVADPGGPVRSRFPVPAGTRIAGKGAWTPDGAGLTLVTQRRCCAGDGYRSRWQLQVVDPATGGERAGPRLPEQAGLLALRLLGWTPDGAAAVARYRPWPGEAVVGFDAEYGITDGVWQTDVVALSPAGPPRTLLTSGERVAEGIDVADHALAGNLTHPGRLPAGGLGPQYRAYLGVGLSVLVAVAGLGVLGAAWILRRRRRRPAD
ncbi:hypothetical protein K7640_09820 [Micromonospora sp. PLK6-60]|uniref:hypothetical protein n=1 Tax=Micromonospora sp. PLK6-60 TaxID=2873383 RepID=UPI001CA67AF0|nr:hypothetical protein [Micromonospora sp. PLK6-60]MBY8872135.1 hypothetical protein [Micromonospora sp. PLK6-60]